MNPDFAQVHLRCVDQQPGVRSRHRHCGHLLCASWGLTTQLSGRLTRRGTLKLGKPSFAWPVRCSDLFGVLWQRINEPKPLVTLDTQPRWHLSLGIVFFSRRQDQMHGTTYSQPLGLLADLTSHHARHLKSPLRVEEEPRKGDDSLADLAWRNR